MDVDESSEDSDKDLRASLMLLNVTHDYLGRYDCMQHVTFIYVVTHSLHSENALPTA